MPYTLKELAELTGGEIHGDSSTVITGVSPLYDAAYGDITLLDNPDKAGGLEEHAMAAVVMPFADVTLPVPSLHVENVHESFAKIVQLFKPKRTRAVPTISPQAFVDPSALIGNDVMIYPFAYIGPEVVVGDNVVIYPHVSLLAGVKIGSGTIIYPHVTIYEDCEVGQSCILHAGVSLGANGFGYDSRTGVHVLSAQLGNVILGDRVDVGANSTIDRGAYGATRIGDGTKIDNLVMIGHNCQIGQNNLLCGQVGIAGSTSTGNSVVMAGQAGIRDHVHIGDRAVLGAKCGVMSDIPAGSRMLGAPACPEREQMVRIALIAKLPEIRRLIRKLEQNVDLLISTKSDDNVKDIGESKDNPGNKDSAS